MRSGTSSGMGKLTAEVRAWVPEATSEALRALAAQAGVTRSEFVRDLLMDWVHGPGRLTVMRLRRPGDPCSAGIAPE
jgi:hypothetical protein